MKILVFLIGFAFFFNQGSAQLTLSAGRIERHENFQSKLLQPRNIDVWLPEGYSTARKYAVIYMHDGQMLFDSAQTWNKQEWGVDETMDSLMKKGRIRNAIVVGIWNTEKRWLEYFPERVFNSLPKMVQDSVKKIMSVQGQQVLSDEYLSFIAAELKPFIDSTYSTLTNRESTFIAGSSMGGLISMYAVCQYPFVFGAAACISTHWPGAFGKYDKIIGEAFYSYLRKELASPFTNRFYFDYGTETLDRIYETYQKNVDLIVKKRGYTSRTWITKKFPGADHSENSWKKRLAQPILFLIGKR